MPAQIRIINYVYKIFSQTPFSLSLDEGDVCGGLERTFLRYFSEVRREPDEPQRKKSEVQQHKSGKQVIELQVMADRLRMEASLNDLEAIMRVYIRIRLEMAWTYHSFPLFQYSKKDKVDVANSFIDALKSPKIMIDKRARAILKNGSLGIRLEEYIKANGLSLKQELNSPMELKSIDQVIDYLNSRAPVLALIEILKQYSEQRAKDTRRMHHYPMFPQFTRQDKIKAVDNFINQLETGSDKLSNYDIAALSQGSLGVAIENFIEEYGAELGYYFDVDRISNLGDLLNASKIQVIPMLGV